MPRSLMSGTAAACFMVAVASFASGRSVNAQNSGPTASERISAIGCVERADQLTATGPATAANVDSQMFVLTNADNSPAPADSQRAVGTTGIQPLFWLDGDKAELNMRVGQKVEVAGTKMAATAVAASGQPQGPSAASPLNVPRLKVDTIKVMAETCPR